MRFSTIFVAVMAAVAEAKPQFTNSAYDVEAGVPFTLSWSGATGPVTIVLQNGPPGNLKDVMVLDASDSGTSFTWTPPATLPSDTYAFEIKDSTGMNWSPQFQFFGTASSSSHTTSTGTSSTTTTASTTTTTTGSSSSSSSSSSSRTSSSSATTTKPTTTATPSNTNDGQRYKSPLALVLVTVAALLYFN